MDIQIDSREKPKAIAKIIKEFYEQGVNSFVSKLFVGDYMNLDNPRIIVDRKQNLTELCGNVCQQHARFRDELMRARAHGVKLIFLCEHGKGIKTLEDVANWKNPRRYKRVQHPFNGKWYTMETKALTGEKLYKILRTLKEKYGCEFLFCEKAETGAKIIEILGGQYDKGGDTRNN